MHLSAHAEFLSMARTSSFEHFALATYGVFGGLL